MPSSIASSTTHTGSISPATACDDHASTRYPRIDRPRRPMQTGPPGRHHVGTPGDIISECPGDFVGIRTAKAAGHLNLQVLQVTAPAIAELASRVPVGRIHANGRGFVPYIRRDLYGKLVAAAAVPARSG